eukprot:2933295-Amphidinium_carterae.1
MRTCAWATDLSGHEYLLPLKRFGDGTAVQGLGKSGGKSISCLTLACILNEGGSKQQQLLLRTWWKEKQTNETLDVIYDVLAWSIHALREGNYPTHSPVGEPIVDGTAGMPLADGYKGILLMRASRTLERQLRASPFLGHVFTQQSESKNPAYSHPLHAKCNEAMIGDLEWHCQSWRLNNPNSHNPCSKCLANTSSYVWTDCQEHASWRETLWIAETWLDANPVAYPIWDQVHKNILGLRRCPESLQGQMGKKSAETNPKYKLVYSGLPFNGYWHFEPQPIMFEVPKEVPYAGREGDWVQVTNRLYDESEKACLWLQNDGQIYSAQQCAQEVHLWPRPAAYSRSASLQVKSGICHIFRNHVPKTSMRKNMSRVMHKVMHNAQPYALCTKSCTARSKRMVVRSLCTALHRLQLRQI